MAHAANAIPVKCSMYRAALVIVGFLVLLRKSF